MMKNKCCASAHVFYKKLLLAALSLALLSGPLSGPLSAVHAAQTAVVPEQYAIAAQKQSELPIQTNEITNWPAGPAVTAEAAIVMESDTGTVLYGKNIHEKLYPASTTKMLTCLIAAEHCSLDEMVTFSANAVNSVPSDGSSIGANVGDSMPMEECLYAILVASANEVATAVGEHVAGSEAAFVDMMNAKARELGCTDSHFANCNGLFMEDHYTSAHDLALIGRAFFNNPTLYRIGNTPTHHFLPTATAPNDFYKTNKHKLINGEIACEGIIGGKTGYTDEARQTLVTGCERGGMRLICVVLKEEAPAQFNDTVTLFNYGYQNFTKVNVAETDTHYNVGSSAFFKTGRDIFNQFPSILTIDPADSVILPNMADFSDLQSTVSYTKDNPDQVAEITYQYNGTPVGTASLIVNPVSRTAGAASAATSAAASFENNESGQTVFINIKSLLLAIALIAGGMILIMMISSLLSSRQDLIHDRKRWKRLKREQKLARRESNRERRRRLRHRRKS